MKILKLKQTETVGEIMVFFTIFVGNKFQNMETNPVLFSFWNRILYGENHTSYTWADEVEVLYKKGIALDEVLQFLHFEKPSWDCFEQWLHHKKEDTVESGIDSSDSLTQADLRFFETNGYLVVKNALPLEDCIQTQKAIWEFLEMDPDCAATWYHAHPQQRGMMVNFFNHPTLEKNRASVKIKRAYEQLYQSESIYKTIDKISFNAPVTTTSQFKGSSLHWDVSLQLPIPFRLQGLIYLSDCNEMDGAFHCVPGFHTTIENWLSAVPAGMHPRDYALKDLNTIPITGKAGDMIIWHQALPHCATPNYGTKPRMVQYLTYIPESYNEQKQWI